MDRKQTSTNYEKETCKKFMYINLSLKVYYFQSHFLISPSALPAFLTVYVVGTKEKTVTVVILVT